MPGGDPGGGAGAGAARARHAVVEVGDGGPRVAGPSLVLLLSLGLMTSAQYPIELQTMVIY